MWNAQDVWLMQHDGKMSYGLKMVTEKYTASVAVNWWDKLHYTYCWKHIKQYEYVQEFNTYIYT